MLFSFSYKISFYLILIAVACFILYPLVVYLLYVKVDNFDEVDYSNDFELNWSGCETGTYIGDKLPEDFSCSSVCGEYKDKEDLDSGYTSIYLNEKLAKIISTDSKAYKAGYWCFPKRIQKCNLNTSLLLMNNSNLIECVTRFPTLLEGNKIIGCAPHFTIVDNLSKTYYSLNIPSTLRIEDIDEIMDDGQYRWTCYESDDTTHTGIGDRFVRIKATCKVLSKNGSGPIFDKETGEFKCKCDNYVNNNEGFICTDCTSGYEIIDEHLPQKGSRYAVSTGVDCIDPMDDDTHFSRMVKIPCGIHTIKRLRGEGRVGGCMRSMIDATNAYTPEILEEIY